MTISQSEGAPDLGWDRFVEDHPLGQFQQTSMWAKAKAPEGWAVRWIQAKDGARIRAGVQILDKRTRVGRIGLINKGPLLDADQEEVRRALISALIADHRKSGYAALIVQPPDGGDFMVPALEGVGFLRETVARMAGATLMIDLSKGWEAVRSGFRRTTRREIRQASEGGIGIVEGTAADVEDFFRLMQTNCRRLGMRPNPGTLTDARALVQAFSARGAARIWFAMQGGKRVATILAIVFGGRVTLWKKGWDPSGGERHVNTLITADIIRWAAENHHRWVDFAMMDRDTAEAMVAGRELPKDLTSRRDFFILGFGGQGLVMPPCLIRFRNPVVALGYRLATLAPIRDRTRRLLGNLGLPV